MRIIDLINKIANEENVPAKVKYDGEIYEYDETDCNEIGRYCKENGSWLFDDAYLNDEVEIVDEKIKKLNAKANYIEDEEVLTKINELIEEVNKLKFEKVKCSSITISGGIIPNSNVTRLNGDNVTYTMSDQVDI